MTPEEKLRMALSAIYGAAPFDASFLHSMDLHLISDNQSCPTAQTDCRKNIWLSRDFADTLDYRSIAFVLCHEARHKVFDHIARAKDAGRRARLDNVAADYIINNGLIAEGHKHGFVTLSIDQLIANGGQKKPEEHFVLADASIDPTWGTREVYDYILSRLPERFVLPGGVILTGDVVNTGEEPTQEEQAETQLAVLTAYAAAKAQGRLPKGVGRVIENLEASRTDWRERIHAFAAQAGGSGEFATDWTYRRPSRRYMGTGPLTPSIFKPPTGEIVVGIDTSGSIGQAELSAIAAEVTKMHQDVRPSALHVVWCDAEVAGAQTFGPDDQLDFKPMGGGGTEFEPVFKWVKANVERPMYLIYFTDGHGSFDFNRDVGCPVMWAVTTDVKPPWGERVQVDLTA